MNKRLRAWRPSTWKTKVVPRESATELSRGLVDTPGLVSCELQIPLGRSVPLGVPASDCNGGRLRIARGAVAVVRWRVHRNLRSKAQQDDVQSVVQGRVKGTVNYVRE